MERRFKSNLVSIIMPVYNNLNFINQSIESVFQQTYEEWELLIIDDGSTDDIKSLIKIYLKDSRVSYYRLEQNVGVSAARNMGIKNSNGRYIAFLDSDDIWHYQKLEKQIAFMKKNNIAFSYTQYRYFSEQDIDKQKIIDVKDITTYNDLLKGNIIGCLTVMINRETIKNIFMKKERHEDYILWLQILKSGYKAYGLKEDLASYRVSSNSLSGNKLKSVVWTWRIYRNIEKLKLGKSLYYFLHYLYKAIVKRL